MADWRALLLIVGIAALLADCGDRGAAVPAQGTDRSAMFLHSQTFTFTGKPQRFKVPHVKWIEVDVRGAAGGGTSTETARGARVRALIPASVSRDLIVYVGGAGNGGTGGFNGGGGGGQNGSCSTCGGYGGGGASDIRLGDGTIGERVVVAAGGGGLGGTIGNTNGGAGGKGGGTMGAPGQNGAGSGYRNCGGFGGGGGTQTAGGIGGAGSNCGGLPGANGSVGSGGSGGVPSYRNAGGGGGGGGYFGAGGGGAGSQGYSTYSVAGGGGGGGGGSSFVGKSVMRPRMWSGWKQAVGNGLVVIDW